MTGTYMTAPRANAVPSWTPTPAPITKQKDVHPMTTVLPEGDNVTTRHEQIMTAGLAMARESVDRWYDLGRADRRELIRVWAEFAANLRALGITVPQAVTR